MLVSEKRNEKTTRMPKYEPDDFYVIWCTIREKNQLYPKKAMCRYQESCINGKCTYIHIWEKPWVKEIITWKEKNTIGRWRTVHTCRNGEHCQKWGCYRLHIVGTSSNWEEAEMRREAKRERWSRWEGETSVSEFEMRNDRVGRERELETPRTHQEMKIKEREALEDRKKAYRTMDGNLTKEERDFWKYRLKAATEEVHEWREKMMEEDRKQRNTNREEMMMHADYEKDWREMRKRRYELEKRLGRESEERRREYQEKERRTMEVWNRV